MEFSNDWSVRKGLNTMPVTVCLLLLLLGFQSKYPKEIMCSKGTGLVCNIELLVVDMSNEVEIVYVSDNFLILRWRCRYDFESAILFCLLVGIVIYSYGDSFRLMPHDFTDDMSTMVLAGIKPSSEPMWTQFYVTIWRHKDTISW